MTEPALVWPPPGLESLHGQLWPVARRLGAASALVVVPLLWLGTAGVGDLELGALPFTTALQFALIFAGCFVLLAATSALWSIASRTTSCIHRGYAWSTVLEVLADADGDTGYLMDAGSPYGALGGSTRRGVRRIRVVRALAALAAAFLPIASLLALATFGEPTLRPAVFITLGPSVVLIMLNALLAGLARVPLNRIHRERDRVLFSPGAPTKVVEAWYETFSRAQGGDARPPRRGGSLWGLFVGGIAAVLLLLTVIVVVPLVMVTTAGAAMAGDISQPSAFGMVRVARAERMRPFAIAVDTSISPLRAGQALFALSPLRSVTPRGPYLKPSITEVPPLPEPDGVFGPGYGSHGRLQAIVIERAGQGLTPAQRAFLAEVAGHPAWELYALVARAPRVDFPDAMLELPLSGQISSFDFPSGFGGRVTQIAYASTSRAAWHLANGRQSEAEQTLRETLSFGLRVMDNSHSESGVSEGATIVSFARTALIRLHEAVGDSAEARRIDALAIGNPRTFVSPPQLRERNALLRGLTDPRTPQGIRWELVGLSGLAACSNSREILFGPSQRLMRAVDSARVLLARTPAEREMFTVYSETVARNALRRQRSPLVALARIPAFLLRNPRIYQCAAAW